MKSANFILENSDLLDASKCQILGDRLFEYLAEDNTYREFFSVDDYDYICDQNTVDLLNQAFHVNAVISR